MASTTVYRSPELAARIVSLHAVAGEFRQEAVDHGAPYRFTDSKAQKKAQRSKSGTLKSKVYLERGYTLANEATGACSDRLDVAVSEGSGRRRLDRARPSAPVASTGSQGEGGSR